MAAIRRTALAVVICLGVPAIWAHPAFAASALTATPHVDLVDGQTIQLSGSGFPGSTEIGFCEAIADSTPEQSDCAGGGASTTTSSPTGDISGQITVFQSIYVPSRGVTVDCTKEACVIGAAEVADIAATVAYASLTFVRVQPDAQIRRLSDNAIFGDDVYGDVPQVQKVSHPIAPGGTWSWAVQVQNDGAHTDDFTVTAPVASGDIAVRYFAGYFDITALVTGAGFSFDGVAPGAVRRIAVQFTAAPGASVNEVSRQHVNFLSDTAAIKDAVLVAVRVVAPA
jgi:hypothetical protein